MVYETNHIPNHEVLLKDAKQDLAQPGHSQEKQSDLVVFDVFRDAPSEVVNDRHNHLDLVCGIAENALDVSVAQKFGHVSRETLHAGMDGAVMGVTTPACWIPPAGRLSAGTGIMGSSD